MKEEPYRLSEALRSGYKISIDTATELDARVSLAPEDSVSRATVLGYAIGQRRRDDNFERRRVEHWLWFVENEPRDSIHSHLSGPNEGRDDTDEWSQLKAAWLSNLAQHPLDLLVLQNAVHFFALSDFALSKSLLERCESTDATNPGWPDRIGFLCEIYATTDEGPDVERRRESLGAYRRAFDKTTDEKDRALALYYVALATIRSGDYLGARALAVELLDMGVRLLPDPSGGYAQYNAHTILGLVSIALGDIDEAARELLRSSRVRCGIVWAVSGATWELASELLRLGRAATVLEFLDSAEHILESHLVRRCRDRIQSGNLDNGWPTKFDW